MVKRPPVTADYRATVVLQIIVTAGADLEALGERLFEFLAADPDDLFPEIAETETFDVTNHGIPGE
jgi:hypothetical protein